MAMGKTTGRINDGYTKDVYLEELSRDWWKRLGTEHPARATMNKVLDQFYLNSAGPAKPTTPTNEIT